MTYNMLHNEEDLLMTVIYIQSRSDRAVATRDLRYATISNTCEDDSLELLRQTTSREITYIAINILKETRKVRPSTMVIY
jgi:hypothetical protein